MTAKTSDWRPGPTVCRCCLTEGCYKDISTEYFWMGKREVYSEMLSDTLNLSIAYAKAGPNSNSRLICEPCISRLRDAHDFRRQVLECEKTFMLHLDPGSTSNQSDQQLSLEEVKIELVKQEKKLSDDEDFDDRIDFVVNDDSDDDLDNEPLMKLASKVPKKEKEVDLLDLLDSSQITVKRKSTASSSKAKEPPTKKAKKREIVIKPSASKATASASKTGEKKKKEISPNVIARKNAALLVQYTTAYPFRLPSDDVCCIICCKEFSDPEEFRQHMMILDDHKAPHKMLRLILPSQSATLKVDITNLRCRVCSSVFDNLDDIASHLSTVHRVSGLNLAHDIGVHPFKIYKDIYTCLSCPEKFVTLRALSRHTQTHYLKHTCETCGKSYSNLSSLKLHTTFSHLGSKAWCKKCKTMFESSEDKQKHISESLSCWLFSCNVCNEKFMSPSLKVKHLQAAHNIATHYTCPECPAVFIDKGRRRTHFTATHTDKFKCSCCSKRFPSKFMLVNHSVVHSSEKKFQCSVCSKEFSRKQNLKQHLPIHMNDKPYKCAVCNKQFNQRVSWKTHMSSYHPEMEISKT